VVLTFRALIWEEQKQHRGQLKPARGRC